MLAWIASALLLAGCFFLTVGAIGLLRLPDVYTRMHATAKCDTLGAALVILAMMLKAPSPAVVAKLAMCLGFFWLINPATAHLIAETALARGVPLTAGTTVMDHYGAQAEGEGAGEAD
ncbi:MAG: monovalent cation/H(+) antiporter subunit G [Bacillota bacterium]